MTAVYCIVVQDSLVTNDDRWLTDPEFVRWLLAGVTGWPRHMLKAWTHAQRYGQVTR